MRFHPSRRRGTGVVGLAAILGAAILVLTPLWGDAGEVVGTPLRQGGGFRQSGSGSYLTLPDGRAAWRGRGGDDARQRSFLEYDLGGRRFPAAQGTIAFELVRDENFRREAVFSLADNNYQRLFAFRIYWEGKGGVPELHFFAPNRTGAPFWYVADPGYFNYPKDRIPLRQPIAKGERVRFVVAWNGDQDGQIFVNGASLGVRTNPAAPFSQLAAAATKVIVGAETDRRIPDGAYSMTHSPITDFRVYDVYYPDGNVPASASTAALIRHVEDDTFKLPGISGKLVAGDKVTATLAALPGGKASFDMGKVKGIAMEEVPPTPGGPGIPAVDNGTYRGSYTIRPGDDFEDGSIVGHFVSADNVVSDNVTSASKWTIDTKPRVTFAIDRTDLPADQKSTARVKLSAKDANGNPIAGRRLKLTLATTDEYTGLVGSGTTRSKEIAAAVKDALGGAEAEARWGGETDSWGQVEFDYTSGFAAKTVILQVKDMDSGGVAVDYITSYKEASIDIALTPPVSRAAARRGMQYIIKVEATRTELTADGRSRSVIRAAVSDPNGAPVPGDPVAFSLSSANGTLRVIKGTTDASGVATAEYTAGTKIGIVVVTALDTARNISGNVSIVLLADAPAKIYLKARPESLPADGVSRADLNVKVTDINDNPNKDTNVEFKVARGGGRLQYPDRTTDRFGDADNRYVAGTTPGIATILATVRSRIPTDAELAKAQNVLFAPYSDLGEDIRISQWLKKKGDTALAGEPIVAYTIGRDAATRALNAPYDCRIDFQYVEYWDYAKTGDTLALITPVSIPGSSSPAAPAAPQFSPRRR